MSQSNQSQNFHPGQHVSAGGRIAVVAFVANGRTYGYLPGQGLPVDLGRVSDFDPCGHEGAERQLELGSSVGVPCELGVGLADSAESVVPFRPTWGPARSRPRTRALTPVAA